MDLANELLESPPVRTFVPRPVWARRVVILGVLVACALAGLGAAHRAGYSLTDLRQWVGARGGVELLTHTTETRDLEITVLASGMLDSASAIEVVSEVEGQAGIIRMKKRGKRVEKGDVVVELDSSAFKTAYVQQQVTVQQAKAAAAQAKEALQIASSQAESDVDTAELLLRFAELDLRKYVEGDYPQEQRVAQSGITLAEEELKRARDRLGYANDLKHLGYLSEGQAEADKLVVLRTEEALKLAKDKQRVLQEFTHQRMMQELESKVVEAKRGLSRARVLAQAAISQAETKLKTQQSTEELEQDKLVHLADQIEKCTLRAPQTGVVLYPIPEGEDAVAIKEGAVVRQHQHVFTIPNSNKLQVSATVHEAVLHLVKPGQTSRVWVDSFPGREFHGSANEVSSVPDLQSWRKSTVNFYPTKVLIEDEDTTELRPGMNAKVEILIETLKDVLAIPVQAVVRTEKQAYCVVLSAGVPSVRPIQLGKSNEQFVVIQEGLSPGENVVLSPDEARVTFPEAE